MMKSKNQQKPTAIVNVSGAVAINHMIDFMARSGGVELQGFNGPTGRRQATISAWHKESQEMAELTLVTGGHVTLKILSFHDGDDWRN